MAEARRRKADADTAAAIEAEERAAEERAEQLRQLAARERRIADAVERQQRESRDILARGLAQTTFPREPSGLGGGVAPVTAKPGPRPTVFCEPDLERWQNDWSLDVTLGGPFWSVIRYFPDFYPAWSGGIDGRWALGLPEQLIDPAWAALYRTCLVPSAPVWQIIDPQVDRDGVIRKRLADTGLVEVYEAWGGVPMLRRLHALPNDPAFVVTTQPRPWAG